jgi:PhzF family phenazine biosynthesis protein
MIGESNFLMYSKPASKFAFSETFRFTATDSFVRGLFIYTEMKENEFVLINVFTSEKARGNQCCVVQLNDLSDTEKLLRIAQDFEFPATAFIKPVGELVYETRWFAKEQEIDLCGHGSIATAWALKEVLKEGKVLTLKYGKGEIKLSFTGDEVLLSAPSILAVESQIPEAVQKGFNEKVVAYLPSENKHLVVLENAKEVEQMQPNWEALRTVDTFAYALTAPGIGVDFVSRTLLPFIDKLEDQATGSSQLTLAPYWSARLDKKTLSAHQLSERGGALTCEVNENKVTLKARCSTFGKGTIE